MIKHSTRRLDVIIEEYRQHLIDCHGVTPATIRLRIRLINKFLEKTYADGEVKLNNLRAIDLHHYIYEIASRYSPETVKSNASSLRSFLRFTEMTQRCRSALSKGVPAIGFRNTNKTPKFLNEKQLKVFLGSFDSDCAASLRNRAMALCLVRMGLRASEVVGMKLEDLDWRNNILHLTGAKGRRHHVLPLQTEVKQSLIDYLSKIRPKTKHRHVFLSLIPAGNPMTYAAVSRMTSRALKRAAIQAPSYGAHLFRHTAAAHLVQHGATVKEIGDFLRHRNLDTTVIYAKVNFPLLKAAVQPWPKVKS